VVPVKAFDRAKERLAGVLNASERAALAERLATGVVTAALQSARPVVVVCDDGATAAWATSLGAEVLRQSVHGLNAAAAEARSHLRGHSSALAIVHADLAHPEGLAALLDGADREPGAVLVPTTGGTAPPCWWCRLTRPSRSHTARRVSTATVAKRSASGLDRSSWRIPRSAGMWMCRRILPPSTAVPKPART